MKNLILTAILAAATASSQISVSRVAAVPPDVAQKQEAFAQRLAPAAKLKIQSIATATAPAADAAPDEMALTAAVGPQIQAMFPGMPQQGQPIDTMVFLVLNEMVTQQQNDLKAITEEMQKISSQRTDLRTRIAKAAAKEKSTRPPSIATVAVVPSGPIVVPPPLPATATLAEMRQRYDDLSSMSEAEQRRLQLSQGRLEKIYGMMSNVVKKLDDTSNSIVSNLK